MRMATAVVNAVSKASARFRAATGTPLVWGCQSRPLALGRSTREPGPAVPDQSGQGVIRSAVRTMAPPAGSRR